MAKQEPQLHKNKVAIVGSPNVGKSALFNQITTSYSLVANFPHTTIAVARAEITIGSNTFEIIDTPGIISLDVQSEDGLVTRSILLEEHPELIILCLDATNLKRSLMLAAQIFELDIPVIVCLNLTDEARQKGIVVNQAALEHILGVPVIMTVASEGRGIKKLLKHISRAAIAQEKVRYLLFIEKGLKAIAECFPSDAVPSDALLLLLLQRDPVIEDYVRSQYGKEILKNARAEAEQVRRSTAKSLARIIFEHRNRWAESLADRVANRATVSQGRAGEVIGALCRHPVAGWCILAGVIYLTYEAVGRIGTGLLAPLLDQYIFFPMTSAMYRIVPWTVAQEFLVGDYGILTTGLANAVGTVLPILTLFFLILNLLEDVGYIGNLCVLSNRLFQRIGLSGKAVLPIILGFGCKTMATLTTKILESKKERTIAVFLIAFAIPCSPLLGINLAILSLFSFTAFLIVFGVLTLIEVAAGLILNKMLPEATTTDFIMEIPPIRLPNIENLVIKTYYRIQWFLIEAVPLFMLGAFILFVLDRFYVLEAIKLFVFPVITTILTLPEKVIDAFLLSLARKEAGSVILLNLAQEGKLDYIQAIVGTIVMTCFFPCFANIMTMAKELGFKTAMLMLLVISLVSVIIGGAVNILLRVL